MTILEKLKADQLQARKAKDVVATALLTTLIGDITAIGKNAGNRETTDEEALKQLIKFAKNTADTIGIIIDKPGKEDALVVAQREEIILQEYIAAFQPKQMSTDEIVNVMTDMIKSYEVVHNEKPKFGAVLKEMASMYKGQYDGRIATEIVKSLLL